MSKYERRSYKAITYDYSCFVKSNDKCNLEPVFFAVVHGSYTEYIFGYCKKHVFSYLKHSSQLKRNLLPHGRSFLTKKEFNIIITHHE